MGKKSKEKWVILAIFKEKEKVKMSSLCNIFQFMSRDA